MNDFKNFGGWTVLRAEAIEKNERKYICR